MGSLVGALYAAGMTSDQIERYGQRLGSNLLRDWTFPKLGLFGGDAIRRFVVERVGARSVESLPIRFAAVATDLRTGEMAVLDRGDLGLAVQASASIPGLLEPVRIDEHLYVDGNPSLCYLTLLREGARAHGLPRHWIAFLEKMEHAH